MIVQSKVDEGTTITVRLPLTPQIAPPSSNIATLSPPSRHAIPEPTQVKKSA
jgi:two-component system, cell cycle sensor histidine kinase DivJ